MEGPGELDVRSTRGVRSRGSPAKLRPSCKGKTPVGANTSPEPDELASPCGSGYGAAAAVGDEEPADVKMTSGYYGPWRECGAEDPVGACVDAVHRSPGVYGG